MVTKVDSPQRKVKCLRGRAVIIMSQLVEASRLMAIIYVRHGKTASNDPDNEKLRGWLPVPLDKEGMQQAEDIADSLSDVKGVKEIRCATLVRVVQTAQECAEALGMTITPMEELNDWDTGDFAGKSVKETLKDLHACINEPLKKVPGGETFQFWIDRITPVLRESIESKDLYVIVSSGRVGTLLKAYSETGGEYPKTDVMLGKPPIDTAGVMIIDKKWKIVYKTAKEVESKGLS
jgi:broad specificity phosphatase PhoE